MCKYKCIIFDCDGVLVDSESIAIGIMVQMAKELGAKLQFEDAVFSLKGKSFKYCLGLIQELTGSKIPDDFEKEYRHKTFEAFENEIKPVEGIKSVLENLTIPFCTASSGPRNKIQLNLEVTGLLSFFEGNIFSCYTIQKWKPEPDVFLWAAKTMGFKPEECLVIEDSVPSVKAALAGGFDVFGYTAQDDNNELEDLATKTFNSMSRLLDMIHQS